jgi:hypothetical protein
MNCEQTDVSATRVKKPKLSHDSQTIHMESEKSPNRIAKSDLQTVKNPLLRTAELFIGKSPLRG